MNRRTDKDSLTYISGSAEYYLKLAVFCLKHRKNTGIERCAEPILSLLKHMGTEEMAARRLINVERLHDENCLVELDRTHMLKVSLTFLMKMTKRTTYPPKT